MIWKHVLALVAAAALGTCIFAASDAEARGGGGGHGGGGHSFHGGSHHSHRAASHRSTHRAASHRSHQARTGGRKHAASHSHRPTSHTAKSHHNGHNKHTAHNSHNKHNKMGKNHNKNHNKNHHAKNHHDKHHHHHHHKHKHKHDGDDGDDDGDDNDMDDDDDDDDDDVPGIVACDPDEDDCGVQIVPPSSTVYVAPEADEADSAPAYVAPRADSGPAYVAPRAERSPRRTYNPGRGCLLVVYQEPEFAGVSWRTTIDAPLLDARWDEKISSIKVLAGTWQFFDEDKYEGNRMTLEPGSYSQLGEQWAEEISSFRCVSSDQASAD